MARRVSYVKPVIILQMMAVVNNVLTIDTVNQQVHVHATHAQLGLK